MLPAEVADPVLALTGGAVWSDLTRSPTFRWHTPHGRAVVVAKAASHLATVNAGPIQHIWFPEAHDTQHVRSWHAEAVRGNYLSKIGHYKGRVKRWEKTNSPTPQCGSGMHGRGEDIE